MVKMSSMSWRVNGSTTWPRYPARPSLTAQLQQRLPHRRDADLSSAAVSSRRMNVSRDAGAPDMMAGSCRRPATVGQSVPGQGSWLQASPIEVHGLARTFRVGPIPRDLLGLGGLLLGRLAMCDPDNIMLIKYQPGAVGCK